jgi:hypothetical protein
MAGVRCAPVTFYQFVQDIMKEIREVKYEMAPLLKDEFNFDLLMTTKIYGAGKYITVRFFTVGITWYDINDQEHNVVSVPPVKVSNHSDIEKVRDACHQLFNDIEELM